MGRVARRNNLQAIALCLDLPVEHSFRRQGRRFLGTETRSIPLSTSNDFSRFGTASTQGLLSRAFAPFMVELFIAERFTRTPKLVAPAALVTKCRLPTRARLSEPIGPSPLDRICNCATACCINSPAFWPSRPRSNRPHHADGLSEVFHRRPFSMNSILHPTNGIETRYYSFARA